MNKIVITGAAGFIGSHVYDFFRKKFPNAEIVIFDKMTYAADIRNISSVVQSKKDSLVIGDLIDFSKCLKVTKNSDLVINLAAESHVDNSFGNSLIFTKTNTLGTHTLIEACKINKVKKIIHVSTDEVYGENTSDIFKEESPLLPTNPYSAAKAGAEMIVKSYYKSFNLPIIVVRANNIFGTRQYPEKIIPKFILRSFKKLPLKLHGDGSNLRHYLSTSDFSRALGLLAREGVFGEVYNIASDIELTNYEMANLIVSSFDEDIEIQYTADRPFNDSRYAVDDSKLRSLGWSPEDSVIEMMPNIIDWYGKNIYRYKDIKFQ
jgi:dTDP-glucose 4,6-dehydratase